MLVTKPKFKIKYIVLPIIITALVVQFSPIVAYQMKHTGSMNPLLEGDDIVIVDRSVPIQSINEGDIIAYESNCDSRSDVILHRVIDVEEPIIGDKKLYTKGDNATNIDVSDQNYYDCEKPITSNNFVGVYTNHIDL